MRVSIVINNRDYGRYLHQCISSALAQTVPVEVVVVDDGSRDDSREIIASFGSRIRAVHQPGQGQAAAMNAGIRASSGDVIAFLDSDDWIFADKAEQLAGAFTASPDADWGRHDLLLVSDPAPTLGDDAKPADSTGLSRNLYRLPRATSPAQDYQKFGDTAGTTSSMVFRRSFLVDRIGPIPDLYTTYADVYLKCSAALIGRHLDIGAALGVRRMHAGQVTSRHGGTEQRVRGRIRYREHCADRVAELAGAAGLWDLSAGNAWWQRKAHLHARCLGASPGQRMTGWWGYVHSLRHSSLGTRTRLAFALREGVLAVAPSRWFTRLWWMTNDGRPALRPTKSWAQE